jgi:uncharacterized membrane protein YhaH (DUF805 family)
MEQNQPQIISALQPPASPIGPRFLTEKPQQDYFTKLFSGRLNRQNYIVGSTFFVLIPSICFMIVLFNILSSPDTFSMPYLDPTNPNNIVMPHVSIASLLETPKNELWSAIGIIFIILSIPYLFSIQVRRLHDLNLNGWWWTINFVPLFSLCMFMPGVNIFNPPLWINIANLVATIASFFSIYVSLWPGTNGPNKYGENPLPRSSFLGDILELK